MALSLQNGWRWVKRVWPWFAFGLIWAYVVASLVRRDHRALITSDLNREAANAYALTTAGEWPIHGGVNSFNSVNPPGVSFGLALGRLFSPGKLGPAECWGGTLMMGAAALCLALWLRRHVGSTWACLAATVCLLGPTGWFYGFNLWPRAHPLWLVLLLWSLEAWSAGRSRWALGAAVAFYGIGCYWMMEFLPAAVLFPIAWLAGRPRPVLAWRPLLAGLAGALVVWAPYLHFESTREFRDLQSMLRRELPPADSRWTAEAALSRPDVRLVSASGEVDGRWLGSRNWGTVWAQYELKPYEGRWGYWYCQTSENRWFFQSTSGETLIDGKWQPTTEQLQPNPPDAPTTSPATIPATAAAPPSFRWNVQPWLDWAGMANFQPYRQPAWSLLGFGLFALSSAALAAQAIRARWFGRPAPAEPTSTPVPLIALLLTVAIGIGGLMLLMLSSADSPALGYRRFYWQWPAQVALMVLGLAGLWRMGAHWARVLATLGALFCLAAGVTHHYARPHWDIRPLIHPPPRAELLQVMDILAAELHAQGQTTVELGYEMAFNDYQLTWHHTDPFIKVGRPLDLALLWAHGIVNTNQRAEGLGPDDTYRLREVQSQDGSRLRIQEDNPPPFEVVTTIGNWQLLRRLRPDGVRPAE